MLNVGRNINFQFTKPVFSIGTQKTELMLKENKEGALVMGVGVWGLTSTMVVLTAEVMGRLGVEVIQE